MGVRFDGVSLNGNISTSQYYKKSGTTYIDNGKNIQTYSNGFGVSFLLPTGAISSLEEVVEFRYSGSGRIYGSYQHAQKSVTLANSKKYTISAYGYGNVLNFDSSVKDSYDAMGGVDLSV